MTDRKAAKTGSPKKKAAKAMSIAKRFSPECPPELGPRATAEWNRMVPLLATKLELSELDRPILAIFCTSSARWLDGVEAIEEYGAVFKTKTGYPMVSPFVAIVKNEAEMMMRIAADYGFTPASRAKMFPREPDDWGKLVDL
jgi:P27 family predicted phage terminase small subunit